MDILSIIPIWVKFPGLPVGYWSVEALSKVSSVVGKPLYTYSYTSNLEKIWYAKILIEVIVAQPLPNSFLIESSSGPWEQPIDYKWRPKFCNDCLIYGHDSKA